MYPVSIEEVRASKQKELRIIDIVEPLLNQHKLVIDYTLVKRDINRGLSDHKVIAYSLIHQITHITRDRGSLFHDDKLDSLALALGWIVETVGVSAEEALERYREDLLDEDLERFMHGVGVNGRVKGKNYLDSFENINR